MKEPIADSTPEFGVGAASGQTTDDWASARTSWWCLWYAIADLLHAVADNIEARIELRIAKRKLKDMKNV